MILTFEYTIIIGGTTYYGFINYSPTQSPIKNIKLKNNGELNVTAEIDKGIYTTIYPDILVDLLKSSEIIAYKDAMYTLLVGLRTTNDVVIEITTATLS